MNYHEKLETICRELKSFGPGNGLTFGDMSLNKEQSLNVIRAIYQTAPSILLNPGIKLNDHNPYKDYPVDPPVVPGRLGDFPVDEVWLRGFVWENDRYVLDENKEPVRVEGKFDVGVELDFKIARVDEKDKTVVIEDYTMSSWDTWAGQTDEPEISAGLYLTACGETGYEGSHIETKSISLDAAEKFLNVIDAILLEA